MHAERIFSVDLLGCKLEKCYETRERPFSRKYVKTVAAPAPAPAPAPPQTQIL